MNNKFRLIIVAVILVLRTVFCIDEDGLEITYDSVGDSVVFTYILEDIIVNSIFEKKDEYRDQVIAEREIQIKQPLNVADAVRTAPDISATAGSKGETNTKIRGFSSEDILVLVDGKPINPGYYGKVDLSMIPTDNIAKIKIIKGPASVAYGTNNTGGIINIITKNGQEKPETRISGMFGDLRFTRLNANHSNQYKMINYWVSGYFLNRDGFRLSDDFVPVDNKFEDGGVRNSSSYLKWGTDSKFSYSPSVNSLYSLSLGYHSSEKEVPPIYWNSALYGTRFFYFPEWFRYHTSLSGYWVMNGKADLKGIVSYDSYQDRLISYKTIEYDDNDIEWDSWAKNHTLGTLWSGSYVISNSNEIAYGLNTLRYYLNKWNIGEPKLEREVQTGYFYADYLYKLSEKTGINAGVSLSSFYKGHSRSLENHPGWSVSFDKEFAHGISVNAGIAQTLSFPTLHQLYSTNSGNEDLVPEECLKYEIGLKKDHEFNSLSTKTSLKTSLFLNDLKNMIEKQSANDQYGNVDARIAGIEVSLNTEITEHFSVDLGYTHMKPYEWGVQMLYESPKDKFSAQLNIEFSDFLINYNFDHNGERDVEYAYPVNAGEYSKILPSYNIHTLNLRYMARDNFGLIFKIENIFDTYYQEEVGFPGAGRTITGGFTLTF
jgi:outer membrane cobalamin receptor